MGAPLFLTAPTDRATSSCRSHLLDERATRSGKWDGTRPHLSVGHAFQIRAATEHLYSRGVEPLLNAGQQRAVDFGDQPLLIIAGAGTGKTHTLAHRVSALIARGADPRLILLLTFSRRAAQEMIRRVARLMDGRAPRAGHRPAPTAKLDWAGTFHSIANRLLRLHAGAVGLDPAFTLLDREDS